MTIRHDRCVVMEKLGVKTVILAGGLGTRLRPYTFFVPKPMLPLEEKPQAGGLIKTGCYVMEPGFLRHIPEARMFGMDTAP